MLQLPKLLYRQRLEVINPPRRALLEQHLVSLSNLTTIVPESRFLARNVRKFYDLVYCV